jgi:hypothetical protein
MSGFLSLSMINENKNNIIIPKKTIIPKKPIIPKKTIIPKKPIINAKYYNYNLYFRGIIMIYS